MINKLQNFELWLCQLLKYINKKRLFFFRKIRLFFSDNFHRINHSFKAPATSVLLITVNERFGDELYVKGLAYSLSKCGIDVSIATLSSVSPRFITLPFISYVFVLDSFKDLKYLKTKKFSVAVDLEYINCRHWRERQPLLNNLDCYTITTSELCSSLNLFDDFISYRAVPHISQRLNLIYKRLTLDLSLSKISPYIDFSSDDYCWAKNFIKNINSKRVIYFNTVAGDNDRWFSIRQIHSMIQSIAKFNNYNVILNSSFFDQRELPKNYYLLPKISFPKLCALIKFCSVVITPDTSVTHIANAFNIPSFVVFPPNDRDYFHEYSAAQAWGSFSDHSVTLTTDDDNLIIDPFGFGYPNRKARPLNTVDSTYLCSNLERFLSKINEVYVHEKI
ncbi:hypothetical protein MAF45_07875 [Mesosutterella sp. OilRF-GAM-744-9]|uniref:ADP-heptose:LPS heptosyltransferase n=2 Tax=Mesosutterella TaxID=2494213 RepID=A0ABS9MRW0_9BURK|nr:MULTISPECIES: glycosyltransferase family 9 protein [unclassified Mesosutterella]MCG5031356.1 hypothetical protein [Mesosutterella sp. oilRF-744-WT-GAM-9]MDL2059476.1 glycosyltransferase family 9 protein [Mesosutterella sp. AGMB02718]